MKYLIQPKVTNGFLKEGLGRWLPAMPSIVKSDPFWTDGDPQVKAYVTEGLLSDTVPNYPVFNPGLGRGQRAASLGLGRGRHHPKRR